MFSYLGPFMIFGFPFGILQVSWLFSSYMSFKAEFMYFFTTMSFSAALLAIFLKILKFATSYLFLSKNWKYFCVLMVSFYLSMCLLLVSKSFLSIVFAWEGLGLASFFLILFYYNWNSIQGANLTMLTNRLGDSFMMVMAFLNLTTSFFFIFILFLMSFSKSAIYPFSSWLPAAMAAPTPVSALVHSSTLVTAGLVLNFKIKFCWNLMGISTTYLYLGTLTMLLGSLSALQSWDMKKLVAFSTLSQLGFMLFSTASLNPVLTLTYLLAHAFLKSVMFVLVGYVMMSSCTQNLKFMGVSSMSVKIYTVMLIIIFNFMSMMYFTLFVIKEMFVVSVLKYSLSLMMSIYTTLILTLSYSLRFLKCLFFLKNSAKIKSFTLYQTPYLVSLSTIIIVNKILLAILPPGTFYSGWFSTLLGCLYLIFGFTGLIGLMFNNALITGLNKSFKLVLIRFSDSSLTSSVWITFLVAKILGYQIKYLLVLLLLLA